MITARAFKNLLYEDGLANDEVINSYMHFGTEIRRPWLYENATKECWNRNRRYLSIGDARIIGRKKVFIPINIGNKHWVLVVMDQEEKYIFFDSLQSHGCPDILLVSTFMVRKKISR